MTSIASIRVVELLVKHAWSVVIASLVAACGTPLTERFSEDEYYPANWAKIADTGGDCRGISGSFENKGVLIGAKGRSQEIWFTDLRFGFFSVPRELTKEELKAVAPFRTCERVSLSFEQFDHTWIRHPFNWRLVVNPSRRITNGPPDQFTQCESFRMPAPAEQAQGACLKNSFQLGPTTSAGLLGMDRIIGLTSDGSLVVKDRQGSRWARFNKTP